MENRKDKDFNDFLKSHDIAKAVEKTITEGDDGLCDVIPENKYQDEFLKNISSPDYFAQQNHLLEGAYLRRDSARFMLRLKEKKNRDRRNHALRIALASTSVAAALLLLFLNVFKPDNPKVETPNVALTNNENIITVPTLITQDSVIQLSENKSAIDITKKSLEVTEIEKLRLVIPKGYTYTIQLSDSTKVTLNAGSELIYPSKFSAEGREVELKGEAYFDVQKDSLPFIIKAENAYVKVYGTEFNINSYNKENIQTVLISGSVGVSIDGKERMMKPNQMMTVNSKGDYKLTNVDTNSYTSWLRDEIVNNNESLANFLVRIGKWYGVEFIYSDDIKTIIMSAEVKNNRPLDEIIRSIELISNVKIIKMDSSRYMVKK